MMARFQTPRFESFPHLGCPSYNITEGDPYWSACSPHELLLKYHSTHDSNTTLLPLNEVRLLPPQRPLHHLQHRLQLHHRLPPMVMPSCHSSHIALNYQ